MSCTKKLKNCTCREIRKCSKCPLFSKLNLCMKIKLDEPIINILELHLSKRDFQKISEGLEINN